jgi:hypothetical protein
VTAFERARHFWAMERKKPRALRRRYARAAVDRRLTRIVGPLCLRRVTRVPTRALASFVAEVGPGSTLRRHIDERHAEFARIAPGGSTGTVLLDEVPVLYALVRALRPERVVETGTANGVSTAYILAALARNGSGRLVSIDLPFVQTAHGPEPLVEQGALGRHDVTPLPLGKPPGWMVPDDLRDRWELRLGTAEEHLPRVLEEVGWIGVFVHDSLHTREHMLFEFRAAWRHIVPGGVLVADDIYQRNHDAFPAFAAEVRARMTTFGNLGLLRKP